MCGVGPAIEHACARPGAITETNTTIAINPRATSRMQRCYHPTDTRRSIEDGSSVHGCSIARRIVSAITAAWLPSMTR